jgi:hypothetical protein
VLDLLILLLLENSIYRFFHRGFSTSESITIRSSIISLIALARRSLLVATATKQQQRDFLPNQCRGIFKQYLKHVRRPMWELDFE